MAGPVVLAVRVLTVKNVSTPSAIQMFAVANSLLFINPLLGLIGSGSDRSRARCDEWVCDFQHARRLAMSIAHPLRQVHRS